MKWFIRHIIIKEEALDYIYLFIPNKEEPKKKSDFLLIYGDKLLINYRGEKPEWLKNIHELVEKNEKFYFPKSGESRIIIKMLFKR